MPPDTAPTVTAIIQRRTNWVFDNCLFCNSTGVTLEAFASLGKVTSCVARCCDNPDCQERAKDFVVASTLCSNGHGERPRLPVIRQ